jgi:hypothetical protein
VLVLSLLVLCAALAGGAALVVTPRSGPGETRFDVALPRLDMTQLEGRSPTHEELRPSVQAAFAAQSYRPGAPAALKLFNRAPGVELQLFRAGAEKARTRGRSEMQGVPVGPARWVGAASPGRVLTLHLGNWPTGLYFARLHSSDGRVGFAPFVLRPRRLGEHRVAVVMPTLTWQAYNLRDDNGDGQADSWYASWKVHTAALARPFLNRGVPYNWRTYDRPFVRWLAGTHHDADFLADSDLYTLGGGGALARAYDFVIFPGHHEYVTTHEYDVVRGYRNLGGHLAFLSANNFFWQVIRHGNVMTRTHQWRDLGRPEASLIGTQYRGNDGGTHQRGWIVRHTKAAPWLFAGTPLHNGSSVGWAGIEIDKTTAASPRGTRVLAEIPNLFGRGFTAQMTYYRTRGGAEVFAAGAFTFSGQADNPVIKRMLANLWGHMAATT